MNKLKLFIIALIGCVMSVACGSDDEPTPSIPDNEIHTVEIPVEGGVTEISIKLKNPDTAQSITGQTDWLMISPMGYGDNVVIRIQATYNNSNVERKATIIINNKVTLNITQKGKNTGNPTDDPTDDPTEMGYNNNTSGKPAYTSKR